MIALIPVGAIKRKKIIDYFTISSVLETKTGLRSVKQLIMY